MWQSVSRFFQAAPQDSSHQPPGANEPPGTESLSLALYQPHLIDTHLSLFNPAHEHSLQEQQIALKKRLNPLLEKHRNRCAPYERRENPVPISDIYKCSKNKFTVLSLCAYILGGSLFDEYYELQEEITRQINEENAQINYKAYDGWLGYFISSTESDTSLLVTDIMTWRDQVARKLEEPSSPVEHSESHSYY